MNKAFDFSKLIEKHTCVCKDKLYLAKRKGIDPVELGLAREGKDAYIQCLDPKKHTGGGTVTFKVSRKDF